MALRPGKGKPCRLLPDQRLSRSLPQDWEHWSTPTETKSTVGLRAVEGLRVALFWVSCSAKTGAACGA